MFENNFFLLLGMIFPLVFSAGPVNIALVSFGGKFGLLKSIPFILGVNLIIFIQSVAVGFGAGAFIERYPGIFQYFKYAGSMYLIYLALKLINSSRANTKETSKAPSFFDGIILQSLNIKVITVIIVIFSQFLKTNTNQTIQVFIIAMAFVFVTTLAMLTWTSSGSFLMRFFDSDKSVKLQGYFFGSMLIAVAIWMHS